MRKLFIPIVLSLVSLVGIPQAMASDIQFSATTVQTTPEGKTMTGKLYVGGDVMRTETTQDDQTRITIVDRERRVAWMLNPAKMEYVEMKGPARRPQEEAPSRPPLPDGPGSACQEGRQGLTCDKLGTEQMNGRTTDKWAFTRTVQGQTSRSVVWIDPELRTSIREEFPGGYVRELRDIREGPPSADLFTVPQGYTKIDMPTQRGGDRGGPGGARPQY